MAVKAGDAYIEIKPDFDGFNRGLDNQLDNTTEKFGKAFKAIGIGVAAGIGIGAVAVKGFVDAAADAQVSQAKMRTQLKASGLSFKAHAKEIDKVIQKTSQLSGLDDEDLQDAFTNIVRTTGDVSQSLKLTGVAADFARAKHIDVAKAGEIVAKVAGGNTGILSRYGVTIDKNATSSEALAALQKKFAGQAEAYGKTAAGAQERFGVATENLQETLGTALLPTIAAVANGLADFINGMQNGTGVGGQFIDIAKQIGAAVGKELAGPFQSLKTVWSALVSTGPTLMAIFTALSPLLTLAAIPIQFLVLQVTSLVMGLGGLVDFIAGVFTGDWSRAWDGIKQIFNAFWTAIAGVAQIGLDAVHTVLKTALGAIGVDFDSAWASVKGIVTGAIDFISGYISWWAVAISTVAATIFDPFITFAKSAWDSAKTAVTTGISAISTVFSTYVTIYRTAADKLFGAISAAVSPVVNLIGDIASTAASIPGKLESLVTEVGKQAAAFAKPLVDKLDPVKDIVKDIVDFIGKIVSGIKSAITQLGKLKLPNVKIPDLNPFSGGGSGKNVGPGKGSPPASVDGFNAIAARFGLQVTSGYRPGDPGYHGLNRARDYSNGTSTPGELAFAKYMVSHFGSSIKELIHTPLGFGLKDGQIVPNSFYADVLPQHYNHVHVALAEGGIVTRPTVALMGESGPEAVIPLNKMGSMAPSVTVELRGDLAALGPAIDVRIKENQRAAGLALRAGGTA